MEDIYEQGKKDPSSLDPQWDFFFRGFELGAQGDGTSAPKAEVTHLPQIDQDFFEKQGRVTSIIYHYRDIGHLMARLDPIGRERPRPENLQLNAFDLTEEDLDKEFTSPIFGLSSPAKLREIIEARCFVHVRPTTETPFNLVLEARA